MSALKIEVYTDVVCPWCLIGCHRLDNVLARDFSGIDVDIEHHPVMLIPDCPPDGLKIADLLIARYGRYDPVAMRARPEAEARAAGITLDMTRQPMFYPTLAAHTLIRMARPLGSQHRLSTALATAYFIDGLNIGDVEILSGIAEKFGFDRHQIRRQLASTVELDETRRAAAISASRGVRSVPHVVIDGQAAPAQDEATLAASICAMRSRAASRQSARSTT